MCAHLIEELLEESATLLFEEITYGDISSSLDCRYNRN